MSTEWVVVGIVIVLFVVVIPWLTILTVHVNARQKRKSQYDER